MRWSSGSATAPSATAPPAIRRGRGRAEKVDDGAQAVRAVPGHELHNLKCDEEPCGVGVPEAGVATPDEVLDVVDGHWARQLLPQHERYETLAAGQSQRSGQFKQRRGGRVHAIQKQYRQHGVAAGIGLGGVPAREQVCECVCVNGRALRLVLDFVWRVGIDVCLFDEHAKHSRKVVSRHLDGECERRQGAAARPRLDSEQRGRAVRVDVHAHELDVLPHDRPYRGVGVCVDRFVEGIVLHAVLCNLVSLQ